MVTTTNGAFFVDGCEIITAGAEETEQHLIDMAAAAVRQSNWTIGEAASKWTERYAAGRTDADFAELIGSSQPTVNRARRVAERFLFRVNKHDFAWMQWVQLLDWPDADECLDWAEDTDATFAEMNAWRKAKNGDPLTPEPVKAPTQQASEPHEPIATPSEDKPSVTGEASDSAAPESKPAGDSQAPPELDPPVVSAPANTETRPHVANNSGEFEWYTPEQIIELAREVMAGIDLDPASTVKANEVVKASRFYDKEQDGLAQPWEGRLWLNPPYAAGLVSEFAAKLVESVQSGAVPQACVLVNNATETRWFQALAAECDAICFPQKRIKFWFPGRELATGLQGQAVLYFGTRTEVFRTAFSEQGVTVAR